MSSLITVRTLRVGRSKPRVTGYESNGLVVQSNCHFSTRVTHWVKWLSVQHGHDPPRGAPPSASSTTCQWAHQNLPHPFFYAMLLGSLPWNPPKTAPWGSTQHPDGWLPIPVRTPAVRRGGRSPLPTGEDIKSMIPYEPHIILADETCSKACSVRLS